MRDLRAHSVPVGFLVLAASLIVGHVAWGVPALAQFPIRQIPSSRPVATPPLGSVPQPQSVPSSSAGWANNSLPPSAFASPYQPPYQGASGSLGTASTGNSLAAWVHQPHPAVARIVVPEPSGVSLGSGTLVDVRGDFGLVVTNWHVVRDASGPIQVEFPCGFQTTAEVVKLDKDWDLAALSIRRPPVAPVPISPQAPRPGQWLAIAGYGSGSWRMVSGPCTQYLAPGAEFPYELVELAAEARQGDSGGPIFNERGELAGVLFGSGPGYTSGSYGGRVLHFLSSVVPGGLPGSDTAPASGTVPSQLAAQGPVEPTPMASVGRLYAGSRPYGKEAAKDATADGVIAQPPQATALHTPPPAASAVTSDQAGARRWPETPSSPPPAPQPHSADLPPLTPVQPFAARPRSAPSAQSVANEPSGVTDGLSAGEGLRPVPEAEDPRVAVAAVRPREGWSGPLAASAAEEEPGPATLQAELPPRREPSSRTRPQAAASTEEVLALVWRQLAGESLYDQGKTVLAIIGLLALATLVLRQPARQAPCDVE